MQSSRCAHVCRIFKTQERTIVVCLSVSSSICRIRKEGPISRLRKEASQLGGSLLSLIFVYFPSFFLSCENILLHITIPASPFQSPHSYLNNFARSFAHRLKISASLRSSKDAWIDLWISLVRPRADGDWPSTSTDPSTISL